MGWHKRSNAVAGVVIFMTMGAAGCSQSEPAQVDKFKEKIQSLWNGSTSVPVVENGSDSPTITFKMYADINHSYRDANPKATPVRYEYTIAIDRKIVNWPPGKLGNGPIKTMAVGVWLPVKPSPACEGLAPFMGTYGLSPIGLPQWWFDNYPYPGQGQWELTGKSIENVPEYIGLDASNDKWESKLYLAQDKKMAVICDKYPQLDSYRVSCSSVIVLDALDHDKVVLSSGYSPMKHQEDIASTILHMRCIAEQTPYIMNNRNVTEVVP